MRIANGNTGGQDGFTLLELLIVIVSAGILVALIAWFRG